MAEDKPPLLATPAPTRPAPAPVAWVRVVLLVGLVAVLATVAAYQAAWRLTSPDDTATPTRVLPRAHPHHHHQRPASNRPYLRDPAAMPVLAAPVATGHATALGFVLAEDQRRLGASGALSSHCNATVGLRLVADWRAAHRPTCALNGTGPTPTGGGAARRAGASTPSPLPPSGIACRERRADGHVESQCSVANLGIDLGLLARHLGLAPKPRVGFDVPQVRPLVVRCSPHAFHGDELGFGMDMWLSAATDYIDAAGRLLRPPPSRAGRGAPILVGRPSRRRHCAAWVEHPVFFIVRYNALNPYHVHEDLLHTFIAYATQRLPLAGTQVVVVDRRPSGPFYEVWGRVFSRGRPVLNLTQLFAAHQHHIPSTTAGEGGAPGASSPMVCFRRALFNVHGGVSLLSRLKDLRTDCTDSPVLQGMSRLLLESYGLAAPEGARRRRLACIRRHGRAWLASNAAAVPGGAACPPLNLTLVVRGNGTARQLPARGQLTAALRGLPFTRVRLVDFAALPSLRAQFQVATETELLVGAHGAGLMHAMYMPSYGGLLELRHSERFMSEHYSSLAGLHGLAFELLELLELEGQASPAADLVAQVLARVRALAATVVARAERRPGPVLKV